MGDAKDTPRYQQGGEAEGPQEPPEDADPMAVGDNPTGWPRRSSGRSRRKKERRLFRGTKWDPGKDGKK